jgi:hypothetical protein
LQKLVPSFVSVLCVFSVVVLQNTISSLPNLTLSFRFSKNLRNIKICHILRQKSPKKVLQNQKTITQVDNYKPWTEKISRRGRFFHNGE